MGNTNLLADLICYLVYRSAVLLELLGKCLITPLSE